MRALRKVTFVNSANIRYAEVKLDGNVHFIGTQGVGKSTLLRAILFFYNADKLNLGIPKEMRSFDEFYLPHANSYIVYEVEHEHGPFSIIVFRSSSRACFRFVDSDYHKEWLIDAHGEVTAEIKVIKGRLNGAYMSNNIDGYEHYRDIIYGNRQAVGKDLGRFQLMETNRYQNIPRSIQNVFLNSRLDANFIKDIIIRSMSAEEANIDLGYFRRQVSDFEQEYKDISCWYKQNQKGESLVRSQADSVVKAYHDLLYMKRQIADLCGELKYAERMSREKLPLLERRIKELQGEQDRLNRIKDEEQQKFDKEKIMLNQELGVVNDKLKQLKERRDYYSNIQIDALMKRCNREQALKLELEGHKEKFNELTARFNDVTRKYEALYKSLGNQAEAFRQAQQKRIIVAEKAKQDADERLFNELSANKAEIEKQFAEKIDMARVAIDNLKTEQNDCEKELLKLNFEVPFKDEIETLNTKHNELQLKEKELQGTLTSLESEINFVQSEYEKKEAETVSIFSRQADEKQKKIDALIEEIASIDKLLSRMSGSLYEGLEENKKGWEQNIGKVIDEDNVLYQIGLHPQLSEGASLFGVKLNLTDLSLNVRKPRQLKEEKTTLESRLKQAKQELNEFYEKQEKAIEGLKRKYTPQMKQLRERKAFAEAEKNMIPQQMKTIKVEIDDYNTKAKELKENRQKNLKLCLQQIAHKMEVAQSNQSKIVADKDKQQKAAEKKYNEGRNGNSRIYEQHIADVNVENKLREQEAEAELKKLQKQEAEELKGRGADNALVDDCRNKIKQTENELKFIEDNRKFVFGYQRDKEDLFDHEDEFKTNKKSLADKISMLSEKYEQRSQKLKSQITSMVNELKQCNSDKDNIVCNLQKSEHFSHDDNLCPSSLADADEKQTLLTPGHIVDKLTGIIVSRHKRQMQFKECINVFKSNFSAKNTFSFRTELTIEDDYLDFANNLNEFLINNKLEDYRTRTSERYVDILARVSKEIGELTRNESDVDKIINAINNDFKERNFVGVIKLIALQSVPSADKMVQLMKRIKDFNDENQYVLGELNIFSISTTNREETNKKAVEHLLEFMKSLTDNPQRQFLTLSDLFQLQFRIIENDNDTGWADKLSHVGSEGTDTLVKAMINIMLINVFKEKVSRKFGDFRIHCMMDEIGKLHPQNIKGILDFANARNILLINSSPTTYNVSDYRYTYLLSKDGNSKTEIHPLISQQ